MVAMTHFAPWERELLSTLRAGRLATIAADGRPQLVPVCYAVVGDALVIAVDEKPKRSTKLARLRNIARDPRVSVLFDRYADDWSQLAWVRVDGTASVVACGGERPDALDALRVRYPQYAAMALEELPLIVVVPERVISWRWGD